MTPIANGMRRVIDVDVAATTPPSGVAHPLSVKEFALYRHQPGEKRADNAEQDQRDHELDEREAAPSAARIMGSHLGHP
jgi:hypothetical protein